MSCGIAGTPIVHVVIMKRETLLKMPGLQNDLPVLAETGLRKNPEDEANPTL
jgi:hypothetical protein